MNADIHRFLKELRDWLGAVKKLRCEFGPLCDHLEGGIASDLESLGKRKPFDGILSGFDDCPSREADGPE
jgi:hypothetical protein